ncbi:hypothetical protein F5X68DRAFT_204135 [Plectosphaerella plurivora]|uniref:Uncharacterized protein n=1 Tax=Plectosphaerella plurivora TaxID=936078 RepID=A0A9P9A9Y4_9PEZI|nr:hypothetical protein F5X68DRAFT_204135 [Plectosphaerella plurivora]
MSFFTSLLAPSTWRHVGLGLTSTVFALGAWGIISPFGAADALGVKPTSPEGHSIAQKAMIFLGIRDVAVAGALFEFHRTGKQREMGVLFVAWTLVCLVDTWVATKGPRGWDRGIWGLCGGAAVVAFVGVGMCGL